MKLLLDHNVSHKLLARLADLFPGSTQTRLLNVGRTNDPQIWLFAKPITSYLLRRIETLPSWRCFVVRRRNHLAPHYVNYAAIEDLVKDPEKIVLELFD